jgi:L-lactate utilization protein LutC
MPASPLRDPVTNTAETVNFEQLLDKLDQEFSNYAPTLLEKFSFELDGVAVSMRRIRQPKKEQFLISLSLGHLPFSVESRERRSAVQTIVTATQRLPNAHFSIDHTSRICVGGLIETQNIIAPDMIFYPLVTFLQEARPFMQLIGKYL